MNDSVEFSADVRGRPRRGKCGWWKPGPDGEIRWLVACRNCRRLGWTTDDQPTITLVDKQETGTYSVKLCDECTADGDAWPLFVRSET